MIWINPVPDAGWYCNTSPIPVAIWFTQGMYVIGTQMETQVATLGSTIEQAQQIGHDMVLAATAIRKGLSFGSFGLDIPADSQHIYVIDSSNVITTGVYSVSGNTVQPATGTAIDAGTLVGWAPV